MIEFYIMWSNKFQNAVFNMHYVEFSWTCIMPVLSGHLAIPRGWPLNTGLTVVLLALRTLTLKLFLHILNYCARNSGRYALSARAVKKCKDIQRSGGQFNIYAQVYLS